MRMSFLFIAVFAVVGCEGREAPELGFPEQHESPALSVAEGDLNETAFTLPTEQQVVTEWYFNKKDYRMTEVKISINAWDEDAAWDEGEGLLPASQIVDQIESCQLFDARRDPFDFVGSPATPVVDGSRVSLTFTGVDVPTDIVLLICSFRDIGPTNASTDFYRFFLRNGEDLQAVDVDSQPVEVTLTDVGVAALNVIELSR